jgi:ferric-dicitrate binding protein FerR (iron transport regulator)
MNQLRRATAILACLLISPLPGMAEPQGGTQRAGQVDAIIPAATRNAQPTKVKDEIDWNDLLKTAHSGRLRAGLTDGSILSVGSDSELRVIQHNADSQQTSLELTYGKVRNQVTNITKDGGKYELKTPNAVIGVIGTDFIAEYKHHRTRVICKKGKVKVTPFGKVVRTSGQANSADNSVTLTDGQMVDITDTIPTGGFQPTQAPPEVVQVETDDTDVPENNLPPPGKGHGGSTGSGLKAVLIGGAVATGIGVGLGVGLGPGGGCKPNAVSAAPGCSPR